MTADPHASPRDRVLRTVLSGPGVTAPALRAAAADDRGLPSGLQALVDEIHERAYAITDEDVARLQAQYGDDALFEIVVSAALGASKRRLDAGLDALERA